MLIVAASPLECFDGGLYKDAVTQTAALDAPSKVLPPTRHDSSVERIAAIAMSTFREAVRDKILLGVVGFSTALLFFSLVLSSMALNEDIRLITHVGHAVISLFSVLTAIFLGSSLLYKEIERKTIYVILPKPIARHEFVLGKYFGIVLTGATFLGLTGSVHGFILAAKSEAPIYTFTLLPGLTLLLFGAHIWRYRNTAEATLVAALVSFGLSLWACKAGHVDVQFIVLSKCLMLAEVVLAVAVAMIFSSFSTPFLTGLMTTGIWLVGRQADDMATVRSRVLPGALRDFLHAMSSVVPNFSLFVPHDRVLTQVIEAHGTPLAYVGGGASYAIVYATMLVTVACLVFRKRSFA